MVLSGLNTDLLEVYECLEFRSFIPACGTEAEAIRLLAGGTTPPPRPEASARPVVGKTPIPMEEVDDVLNAADERTPAPDPFAGGARPPQRSPADEAGWKSGRKDDAPEPSDVDVSESRVDSRVGQDKRLRSMGWEGYGERLRRRAGQSGDAGSGNGDTPDGSGEDDK